MSVQTSRPEETDSQTEARTHRLTDAKTHIITDKHTRTTYVLNASGG